MSAKESSCAPATAMPRSAHAIRLRAQDRIAHRSSALASWPPQAIAVRLLTCNVRRSLLSLPDGPARILSPSAIPLRGLARRVLSATAEIDFVRLAIQYPSQPAAESLCRPYRIFRGNQLTQFFIFKTDMPRRHSGNHHAAISIQESTSQNIVL